MRSEKPRVLVVDDSRVVRHAVTKVLGAEYQIVEAADGQEGWHLASQRSPVHLVISDINMPQLDGYGMICKIRGADEAVLRNVPIIVITSAEDDITRERAYACGANDFILKPFNAHQLLDCTRTHLTDRGARAKELDAQFASHVENIVICDSPGGADEDAAQVDAWLNALDALDTEALVQRLPRVTRRLLPVLRHYNAANGLGLERELDAIEGRLSTVGAPSAAPATHR